MPSSEGENVGRDAAPKDIIYMKILLNCLRFSGGWSEDENNGSKYTKLYRVYLIILEGICFVTQLKYLTDNIGQLSFYKLGHSYVTQFMNIVAFTRLVLPFLNTYHNVVRYFVSVIHLANHKHKSAYAMETHLDIDKKSHYFTYYMFASTMANILIFNIVPLYGNITSDVFSNNPPENFTYSHSIYYYAPFDYTTNFKGYLVVFTFNWYICYVCCCCFCAYDLLLSLMIFHLWGHIKILIYNLNNFPKPRAPSGAGSHLHADMFSDDEMKCVLKEIGEIIDHHNLIVKFASTMSDTFGWVLLIYYGFHQVNGCFLLLQCSKMDAKTITSYGPLTAQTFLLLIQVSVVFELLGSMGDKLPDAVYNLPWVHMKPNHRKLVVVSLIQSQRPLNVKALNMVSIGVQTMLTILKNCVSYFIMLRTIATVDN